MYLSNIDYNHAMDWLNQGKIYKFVQLYIEAGVVDNIDQCNIVNKYDKDWMYYDKI